MCSTVSVWFKPPSWMDCRVRSQVIAFGGAHRFAHFWQKNHAILKRSSTSLTVTTLCIYPIDVSRLKSGIRRTPFLLETQKIYGKDIFVHSVVSWHISQIFLVLAAPKYSRVKGGGHKKQHEYILYIHITVRSIRIKHIPGRTREKQKNTLSQKKNCKICIHSNRMWWNTAASHELGETGLTQRVAFQLFGLHWQRRDPPSTAHAAACRRPRDNGTPTRTLRGWWGRWK